MSLTITPVPFFLAPESVKLGRLITNIEHPHEGYFEPPFPASNPIVDKFAFAGNQQNSKKNSFGSALSSLMSTNLSKHAQSSAQIAPSVGTSYTLDNSDDWFDKTVGTTEAKRWIERAALRGNKIYMVVGIQTLNDPRILLTSGLDRQVGGEVTVPVSLSLAAAGVILPFSDILDPKVSGEHQRTDKTETAFFAPGERVCSLQYRKIGYRWLSSNVVNTLKLSKTLQWSCLEGDKRDAYDDDEDEEDEAEDVIAVDVEDVGEDEGGWEVGETEDGVICIRS